MCGVSFDLIDIMHSADYEADIELEAKRISDLIKEKKIINPNRPIIYMYGDNELNRKIISNLDDE